MKNRARIISLLLTVILLFSLSISAKADLAEFEYKLKVTNQNGETITNPRAMKVGDTLNVEIELTRTDRDVSSYKTYGFEFRLFTRGLSYNGDGVPFNSITKVTKQEFLKGDSVGFSYYDINQQGVEINNPILAGRWSYRVSDPSIINIKVPVAVLYVINDPEPHEPVGNALIYIDLQGGTLVGGDFSGEYKSGTIITLPEATMPDHNFLGWSDGEKLYKPGEEYTVSGITTLTAMWEGFNRNRQIQFEPNGGAIKGEDPSGMYADGEVVTMPEAEYPGRRLTGWSDVYNVYKPGDTYVVDNSKVFKAIWEIGGETTDEPGYEPGEPSNVGLIIGIILGVLALGAGVWWFIIFWKRRWVKYSLVNGDIALYFKDRKHTVKVAVVLMDGEDNYALGTSGVVKAGERLRFIKGNGDIVYKNTGTYKGMLIAAVSNSDKRGIKCRIKVLDRELDEKKNG